MRQALKLGAVALFATHFFATGARAVDITSISLSLKADNAAAHEALEPERLARLRTSLDLYVVPNPIDPSTYGPDNLPEWSFSDSLDHLQRLMQAGLPAIISGSRSDNETFSYLDLEPEVLDDGTVVTATLNIFDQRAWAENLRLMRTRVREIEQRGGPIEAHALTISSNWGEIEYYIGHNIHNWEQAPYTGYSQAGQADFRAYLQQVYAGDLTRLNHAWGTNHTDWNSIEPPRPVRGVPVGTFDGRPDWVDFNFWHTRRLTDAVVDMSTEARAETQNPLEVLISFSHTKGASGPAVGELAKRFSQFAPVYFHCTDGLSLAAVRYMDSARRFYGIPEYLVENDGDRFLYHSTVKLAMAGLMGGGDRIDYCAIYNLGVHKQGYYRPYPNDVYYLLRDVSDLTAQLRMQRPQSRAAFLYSNVSRYVRAPQYHNLDVQGIYDTVLSQTRAVAGWGQALGYPDVIDEQMIEEGRLDGLRLLVVPNTSTTLLPAIVQDRIAKWVRAGGWLVLTGPGALLHRLEADHRVTQGDSTRWGDLAGGLLAEGIPTAAAQVPGAPVWRSGTGPAAGFALAPAWRERLQDPDSTATQARLFTGQWLEAPAEVEGLEPLMIDEEAAAAGTIRAAAWLQRVGEGGVLFSASPAPEPHLFGWNEPTHAENVPFYASLFPLLLEQAAVRAGVDDFVLAEGLRLASLGINQRDGLPTFMAFSLSDRRGNTELTLPASLAGQRARLLIFGQPLAGASWSDGSAQPFTQPSITAFWGDPTNSVLDDQGAAMLPHADLPLDVPASPAGERPRLVLRW